MQMNNTRITQIDALKGYAILGIVMVHSGMWDGWANRIASSGANACQLFFIISGYLMYGSYHHSCSSFTNQDTKNNIFWVFRKIIRFIPLWLLALFVYVCFGQNCRYWLASEETIKPLNIISHIFFMHNLYPYYCNSLLSVEWYIGCVAIFIILMPVLYRALNSRFLGVILFLVVYEVIMFIGIPILEGRPLIVDEGLWISYIGYFGFWTRIPAFVMGAIVYYVQFSMGLKKIKDKKLLSLNLLVISIIMIYGCINNYNSLFGVSSLEMWTLTYLFLFISQIMIRWRLFDNVVTRTLGKYSYPIYLFHPLILQYYNKVIPSTGEIKLDCILRFVSIVFISLCFGIAVTYLIQKPCVNLLERQILRIQKKCMLKE